MFRNALIASVIALGTAGAAQAQDVGPRLIGGGADGGPRVEYAVPSQNVVGGGDARFTGDRSSRSLAYAGQTAKQAPSGLVGQLVGGADEQKLVYVPAPATAATYATRLTSHGG
ncbi:hypothetical protein [Paracraurococcus lichenis]|uniref:Uncharacterized protein n=1 Tax=Paracraurococcus lichenis TaxID=3064888 RepID=A0ABT9E8N3_9PROT|nr:hypothetical protein [Paracraurococcus sp. LOR1-02]MDO9712534.1 hypothetical protein [Paracraurococcus sp. LOR1-02]